MSRGNVEIVRGIYAHWARGDFEQRDFYDADIEHSRIGGEGTDIQGNWQGLDGLSAAMAKYFDSFADLRIQAEQIIDLGGDRVLGLSRHTAQGKTSGAPIDHQLGDLFTLRDGKVLRLVSYWDRAQALKAAGLLE